LKQQWQTLYDTLIENLKGSKWVSELLITGLLAEGHVLIQGGPGMGKTSLAKVLALSVGCPFTRIQFTPDLLPADILGYSIYNQSSAEFVFHRGPIFSNIVLVDEINRASPRTQSALLESMNERQVSIDGHTHSLELPFFVVATQNHLASAGTFPLPDSQLDRFLISFDMPFPAAESQIDILELHAEGSPLQKLSPVMTKEQLIESQERVRHIPVSRNLMKYIVMLCKAVESTAEFVGGVSPRAQIGLMRAAQAQAYLMGDKAAYPDHIKPVLPHVFRHRLEIKRGGRDSLHRIETILAEIVGSTPVPVGKC
jgi:MoxR-like ATPase